MWETLRRDRCSLVVLTGFVIVQLTYVQALWPQALLDVFANTYAGGLQLPLLLLALLCGLRRLGGRRERHFWMCLSLAFSLWWLNALAYSYMPADWWGPTVQLITDSLFVGYYVALFFAFSIAPHRARRDWEPESKHFLRSLGILVLVVGFWIYTAGVPTRVDPELYRTWLPSYALYLVCELLLVALLLRLARDAGSRRWRILYRSFAAVACMSAALVLLEAMLYRGWLSLPDGQSTGWLWNWPFLGWILVARLRHQDSGEIGPSAAQADALPAAVLRPSSLMLLSLALPLLHIGGYRLGVLGAPFEEVREQVVLICVAVLGVLATLESTWLSRLAHRVAAAREEMHQLRVDREVAVHSDEAKSRFVANVSHEVRTPLHGILGMTRMLRDAPLPQRSRKHADLLQHSAKDLLRVLDALLDYSMIESGALRLQHQPFALRHMVRELGEKYRSRLDGRPLRLRLEVEPGVPEHLVGDGPRLLRIFAVFLDNALKYTDSGEVVLSVQTAETVGDDPESPGRPHAGQNGDLPDSVSATQGRVAAHLYCSVRDTGIGVSAELQPRLFQPFSQADSSSSRSFGGTGLDLAICKRVVTQMGGKIGFHNCAGDGAQFWIEVPMAVDGEASEVPTAALSLAWDGSTTAPLREPELADTPEHIAGRRRVLLAEDNPVSQLVAVQQLAALGCDAEVVQDGQEALDKLVAGGFDLVLMDCQMPVLDGFETVRRWRGQENAGQRLPIIAVTAHSLERERLMCLEAGMDDVLSKPFDEANLRSVLLRWLPELAPVSHQESS